MNKIVSSFSVLALVIGTLWPMQVTYAASAGDLIKCPDFSSVYYLAEDGKRYVFPNEQIFFSWYTDFSEVKMISCEDLATLSLGKRIVYQAGTRLVKIPSDPSVFVVEHDGVLREIPDEETAILFFGPLWSLRVDDVSESFWSSFTVSDSLEEGEVPEGTILEDEDGNLFRVQDDGTAMEIDSVLTTDQEDVLEEHALSLEDIEEQLGIALALTRVDAQSAIEVLSALLARLQVVEVEEEDEEEVGDFDEVEEEGDDEEDALDAIEDATEEITEAQEDIAQEEEEGRDITESEALLVRAQEHLSLAKEAFEVGDFELVEEHADEAQHDAMWARGKAVDSIDEDEDDQEGEQEDEEADEDAEEEEEDDADEWEDQEKNNSDE